MRLLRGVALAAAAARTAATTLAAARFSGGVALGADSRATQDGVVADAFCDKLHKLADNCWAGGCGAAADADEVARGAVTKRRGAFRMRSVKRACS